MNIGKLTIKWDRKPKDLKFVNVSLMETKLEKDTKNLKNHIKNNYEIYDQYRHETGVVFLLVKD